MSLVRWFSVSAERVSSTSCGSSSTSRIILSFAIVPPLDEQRKGKVEGSPATHAALRPGMASVSVNDTPDGGQPDAGALELLHVVQPLEHPKEFVYVLHIESDAVVPDEEH